MLTLVAFSQESIVKFTVLTEAHVSILLVNAFLGGGKTEAVLNIKKKVYLQTK